MNQTKAIQRVLGANYRKITGCKNIRYGAMTKWPRLRQPCFTALNGRFCDTTWQFNPMGWALIVSEGR